MAAAGVFLSLLKGSGRNQIHRSHAARSIAATDLPPATPSHGLLVAGKFKPVSRL